MSSNQVMGGLLRAGISSFKNLKLGNKINLLNKRIILYHFNSNVKTNNKLRYSPVRFPTQELILKNSWIEYYSIRLGCTWRWRKYNCAKLWQVIVYKHIFFTTENRNLTQCCKEICPNASLRNQDQTKQAEFSTLSLHQICWYQVLPQVSKIIRIPKGI